jgi:hypothetical protein
MHDVSTLTCEVNSILLLDYKLTLPKYNITKIGLVELEVCAAGSRLYVFCLELFVISRMCLFMHIEPVSNIPYLYMDNICQNVQFLSYPYKNKIIITV